LLTKHTTRRWPIESYIYLEEELVELQNMNRRLVIDYTENETKKLRYEIDNLRWIVGGMTVPLKEYRQQAASVKNRCYICGR
jgi:hypothetical protein